MRHQLLAVNMGCLADATFLCWCALLLCALLCVVGGRVRKAPPRCRVKQQENWLETIGLVKH